MVVRDGDRTGLHAHEIRTLPGMPVVADRQPRNFGLRGPFQIVGKERAVGDADAMRSPVFRPVVAHAELLAAGRPELRSGRSIPELCAAKHACPGRP